VGAGGIRCREAGFVIAQPLRAVLHHIRVRLETRGVRLLQLIAIVIGAITAMGLLLTAWHGIEAALWSAVYLWVGAPGSPEAAILYSAGSGSRVRFCTRPSTGHNGIVRFCWSTST
jgi:hypothetical protein